MRSTNRIPILLVPCLLLPALPAVAQIPIGDEFAYQGQLLLNGSRVNDMANFEFTLWDSEIGGTQIGPAVLRPNVDIVDGLFMVELDFGPDAFDGDQCWLEITVDCCGNPPTLLSPRQKVSATPYAGLAKKNIKGSGTTRYIAKFKNSREVEDSIIYQAATNLVGIGTTTPTETLHVAGGGGDYGQLGAAGYGVKGYGYDAGGYFDDLDGSGWAEVARDNHGIGAFGTDFGGVFSDTNGTSLAYTAIGDTGVEASGGDQGGWFYNAFTPTNAANLGTESFGVEGRGSEAGGYFEDADGTGWAEVGRGDHGIGAFGTGFGGVFSDTDGTSLAYTAIGDTGVEASGGDQGGWFYNAFTPANEARLGTDTRGVEGFGSEAGGYFEDTGTGSNAYLGSGSHGVIAAGDIETDSQFVSTVSSGTPPLDVASTTRVPNLNADKLDGSHGCTAVKITGYADVGDYETLATNDLCGGFPKGCTIRLISTKQSSGGTAADNGEAFGFYNQNWYATNGGWRVVTLTSDSTTVNTAVGVNGDTTPVVIMSAGSCTLVDDTPSLNSQMTWVVQDSSSTYQCYVYLCD